VGVLLIVCAGHFLSTSMHHSPKEKKSKNLVNLLSWQNMIKMEKVAAEHPFNFQWTEIYEVKS
jgi:hypothetical protein